MPADRRPFSVSANRVLSEQSQTYRLRCCRLQQDGFPSKSELVTADTYWPEDMYLQLNGQIVETRLPLHHKDYLAIDLTKFIRPGWVSILHLKDLLLIRENIADKRRCLGPRPPSSPHSSLYGWGEARRAIALPRSPTCHRVRRLRSLSCSRE